MPGGGFTAARVLGPVPFKVHPELAAHIADRVLVPALTIGGGHRHAYTLAGERIMSDFVVGVAVLNREPVGLKQFNVAGHIVRDFHAALGLLPAEPGLIVRSGPSTR